MKVGSLVELVDDNWLEKHPNVKYPVKGKIYTVRDFEIDDYDEPSLYLVEIINPVMKWDDFEDSELSFYVHRFRELQPPMEISIEAILEMQEK